jgi:beta-glucosidase
MAELQIKAQKRALPYLNPDLTVKERVEDLLSRMTLSEKIGQMTQLDITLINITGEQKDVELDPDKTRDLIRNHHIGSFLNGEAVPARTWHRFMTCLTRIAVEESRLGIPIIYGIDHIHGASYLEGATIFPHNINLGATFNPKHARNTGRVTALESAGLGHHWVFAPVLDLGVNPLWPRFWETYGEDPHLASLMGAAYVDGLQNCTETLPHRQAATAKHYIGYSDPRSGRDRTPVHLSMQQIHEFHRPSFQKAIDAGLNTIMTNSGEISSIPVIASYDLMTRLLRDDMGFEGVLVTDWDDIGKLEDFHHTAHNFKEATFAAVEAGIDVSMTPLHLGFNESLLELVDEGRITEERIDESVRRVLRLKFELGLFEHPYPPDTAPVNAGSPGNRKKALEAARDSVVLLKNRNHVLPAAKPKRIGLFGISAKSKRNLCGGWTLTWQGAEESRFPEQMPTLFDALSKEYPGAEVTCFGRDDVPGLSDSRDRQKEFLAKLNSFDLLIYAGGEEPYCEFAGNINDLRLPEDQAAGLKLLSKAKAPLVFVLISGRPLIITQQIEDSDAILFAGLPGFEGAEAIAGIISGRFNPTGRLPFSYPVHPNHFLPYNHKKSSIYHFDIDNANQIIQKEESYTPYPFGFGLSYTTFRYSRLSLGTKTLSSKGTVTAEITVTNTGSREGTETVLWFMSAHKGRISRPVKELKHFEQVSLKPGESAKMSFTITPDHLSYPDEKGKPILEPGTFSLMAGGHKENFRFEG